MNKETKEILNDDDAMQAIAEGLRDLDTGQVVDINSKTYDYEVKFIGDDITLTVVVTHDSPDIDHDEIISQAEQNLCSMWGVKSIPNDFYIVDVECWTIEI